MSNYQQNRKAGTVMTSAGFAQRQAPLTRVLKGNGTPIVFSIDHEIRGHYAIIDASDLQPSHLGSAQNPFHFIPEAQPRNRATSASGALTPERIAKNLRPDELLYGLPAYSGPPVVNQRGEVIQGNGRAYALKLYYSQFPNDEKGYQKAIIAGNYLFGVLLLEQMLVAEGITKPVLVRMLDVPDRIAIELGQYTQADTEAVATNITKVKSKARMLNKASLRRIINELTSDNDNDDSSLAELIRSSKILNVLIREEIIRTDDLENYTKNGTINEAGVTFVSSLLLNALFRTADVNTSDVLTQLPAQIQNAVGKSTVYLLACQGTKSLNNEVAGAVLAYREFQKSGIGSLRAWSNQLDISGKTPVDRYPETERAIADLFARSVTQKEIVARFRQYSLLVNNRAATMFEPARPGLSKRDAVREVFNADYRPSAEFLATARNANRRIVTARSGPAKRRTASNPATVERAVDHSQANQIKATGRRAVNVHKAILRQGTTAQRAGSGRPDPKKTVAPVVDVPRTPATSALQRQYHTIKATYPGAILLFRVGDYFETFNEDAVIVSKLLKIPLTTRPGGQEKDLHQLAGFPYKLLETNLPKLARAGYRIAIADQLHDPKLQATVERAVTSVVEARLPKTPTAAKPTVLILTPKTTIMETEKKKSTARSPARLVETRRANVGLKKAKAEQKSRGQTNAYLAKAGSEKRRKAADPDETAGRKTGRTLIDAGRTAKATISRAKDAQKRTATKKAAAARKNKGTVKVKTAAEQQGTQFVQELGALAEKIHKKSATGQVREVPVYGISRKEAGKKAYQALKRTKGAKNVGNVRLKVK